LRGGTSTLPVIDIDGTRIGDSSRIIEQLELRWPDPPLYPSDPAERREALELEDFFDEHCAHELRRVMFDPLLGHPELMAEATGTDRRRGGSAMKVLYPVVSRAVRFKYDVNPERAAEARGVVEAAMDRLEQELGPSGYLVGDSFSVADLTAAAILSPLVRPPEFPYHQVDPSKDPAALREWWEPLAGRPGWNYVLDMYARHRGTSAEVAAG
jgi:glutathione S-transferase